MDKIKIGAATPPQNRAEPQNIAEGNIDQAPKRRRRQRGTSRYGRMNTFVGNFLVLLVILSAIPVASNRPAWWLIWTMILGALGLSYVFRSQYLMGTRRSFQTSSYRAFFVVALMVPLYALFQALPLADFLPADVLSLPDRIPASIFPHSISLMPEASLLGAIRAVGFLVFLMLTIEIGTRSNRNHTLGLWLMIGILAHGIFGIVSLKALDDFALSGEKEAYLGMLTGTFINRNSIATFLGFGLIIALAYALVRSHETSLVTRDRGYRMILTPGRMEVLGLWLALAVLAVAILLTQSRMGAFAAGVGAFITFVTLRLHFKVSRRRIALESLFALSILIAFIIPAAGSGVIERALFTLVGSNVRVNLYIQTLGMIADRPWVGFGYDAFAPAFELYRAPPLVNEEYADLAHNTYLALWSEQGLIIGSIPMILIGWAALMISQNLRRGEGDVALSAAAIGVIVLGAIHSTVDFSLEIPANVFCFLLIVGLAMARPRLKGPDKTFVKATGSANMVIGRKV